MGAQSAMDICSRKTLAHCLKHEIDPPELTVLCACICKATKINRRENRLVLKHVCSLSSEHFLCIRCPNVDVNLLNICDMESQIQHLSTILLLWPNAIYNRLIYY